MTGPVLPKTCARITGWAAEAAECEVPGEGLGASRSGCVGKGTDKAVAATKTENAALLSKRGAISPNVGCQISR